MPGKSWKRSRSMAIQLFITLLAMFLLSTIACQKSVDEAETKVITLKYSSAYMPSEPPVVQANHALDLVEAKTNGRVKIERFMGGALGGTLEQLDLVSSGAVDITSLHFDQFPEQLPLYKILNEEQFVDGEQALANVTALAMEIPETSALFEAEQIRNNIKVLYCNSQGRGGITTGFAAQSLDDLKGKKINVIVGFQRNIYNDLGIIPVNVQIPELYESLSRGVIDAIFMATAAVIPLKWYEVAESHLVMTENCNFSMPITLNLDTWNSLPADIQQAFLDASLETAQWSIEYTLGVVKATYDIFEKSGVELVNLSEEESLRFFELFAKYASEDSLDNAKARGAIDEANVIYKYWDDMKWGR